MEGAFSRTASGVQKHSGKMSAAVPPTQGPAPASFATVGRLVSWPLLLLLAGIIGLFIAGAMAPDVEHGLSLAFLFTSGVLVTPAFVTTEIWEALMGIARRRTREVAVPRVVGVKWLVVGRAGLMGWIAISAMVVVFIGLALVSDKLPDHRPILTTGVIVGITIAGCGLVALLLIVGWVALAMLYWKVAYPAARRSPMIRAVDVATAIKDRPATLAIGALFFAIGTVLDLASTYLHV